MALTKAQVKANVSKEKAKADFKRKYGALQKNIALMQNRINTMVKSGGGPVLETEENKKILDDMLTAMASSASSKNYDGNLDAQKKYLEKQLEMLTAKDVVANVEKRSDTRTKLQTTIYEYLVKELMPGGDNAKLPTLGELEEEFGILKGEISQDISKFIAHSNEYIDRKYPWSSLYESKDESEKGGILTKWSAAHVTEYGQMDPNTGSTPILYYAKETTENMFASIEKTSEFKDADKKAYEVAVKLGETSRKITELQSVEDDDYQNNVTGMYQLAQAEIAKLQSQMKPMLKQIEEIQKQFLQDVHAAFQSTCSSYDKSLKKAASMTEKMNAKVLKASQKQVEVQEKAMAALDKLKDFQVLEDAAKKFAKLPQDLMKEFDKLEGILFFIVSGFVRDMPSLDIKGDIDTVIQALQSMMDPVFDGIEKLQLPLPKVAQPITNILKMFKSQSSDTSTLTDIQKKLIEEWKDKAQIPTTWLESLSSMMQTVNLLMAMMLTLLIQLIFNMIGAIVKIIKQNRETLIGGALELPFPLNLIDIAIELMPKIFSLMKMMPQVMMEAGKKKFKEMAAQMQVAAMGFGDQISELFTSFPTVQCPEQVKKAIEEKVKAEKEKQNLAIAERNKKILEARKKSSEEIQKAKKDMYSAFGNGFMSSLKDLGEAFSEDAAATSMLKDMENKSNTALILQFQNDAMANRATIENQAVNKVSKVNEPNGE